MSWSFVRRKQVVDLFGNKYRGVNIKGDKIIFVSNFGI